MDSTQPPFRDVKPSYAVNLIAVHKSFGEAEALTHVLRGVDMRVRTGELMMLVGPSGCGKTTLLSIISGTLTADDGIVKALDLDMENATEEQKTRFRSRDVGFLFQQFNLIPSLTSVENVAIPLLINGMGLRAAMRTAADALCKVGLVHRRNEKPPKLSGGEQQRVAIARAIVHRPSILLCDEPTSSLDSGNGNTVMKLLRDAADEPGRTVIVVTHDSRIYHFADRMAIMEDGRIRRVLDKAEIGSAQRMYF